MLLGDFGGWGGPSPARGEGVKVSTLQILSHIEKPLSYIDSL